jgi:hypothetical protein
MTEEELNKLISMYAKKHDMEIEKKPFSFDELRKTTKGFVLHHMKMGATKKMYMAAIKAMLLYSLRDSPALEQCTTKEMMIAFHEEVWDEVEEEMNNDFE